MELDHSTNILHILKVVWKSTHIDAPPPAPVEFSTLSFFLILNTSLRDCMCSDGGTFL